MGQKIQIIIVLLCFLGPGMGHPFYLSVTDLKYNTNEKAIQGTVKMFSNDLEDALGKLRGERTDLLNPPDKDSLQLYLSRYLAERLKLTVNYKPLNYKVIGFQHEEESTWLFLEAELVQKPVQVAVFNSILCDYLPGQMNIVHLQVDGKTQTSRSDCKAPSLKFEF